MGNTVNRPSQSTMQWINVKDANGNVTRKKNTAYVSSRKDKRRNGAPDPRAVVRSEPSRDWGAAEMDELFEGMDMERAEAVLNQEPMDLRDVDSAIDPAFEALVAGTTDSADQVKKWPAGLAEERLARLTEFRTDHWYKHYHEKFDELTNLGLTDLEAGEQGYGDALRYEYAGLLRDDDSLQLDYADHCRETRTNVKKELISRLRNK